MGMAWLAWLVLGACAPPASPEPVEPEAVQVPDPPEVPAPQVQLQPPTRAVTSPAILPQVPEEVRATRIVLDKLVRETALRADNPWALGHALMVLGPQARLPDGRLGVDALFEDWAVEVPVGDEVLVDFPQSRGAARIEPHSDTMLKFVAELGLDPQRQVTVQGKPHVVADLYRHTLWSSWVQGEQTSFASWNDSTWALLGVSAYSPPGLSWTARGGHAMSMDAWTSAVVEHLAHDSEFLHTHMQHGSTYTKRGQGVLAYSCGGTHLIMGTAYAVARGFGTAEDRAVVQAQVPVLFYRIDIELKQLRETMLNHPDQRLVLASQQLKFTGHMLEALHTLAALDLYQPTEAQQQDLKELVAHLVATVAVLQKFGVLDNLDAIRAEDEQLYLDFVGDACHAARALDLATGVAGVRY